MLTRLSMRTITTEGFFMKYFFSLALLLLASCEQQTHQVGSQERPFIMALIPSENATNTLNLTDVIEKHLTKSLSQFFYQKDAGFYVKVILPNSYVATLESFGSQRVDFAPISTLNYILAKNIKKLPIETILIGLGDGESRDHYFSQIIVREDSGINNIQDLNNKKFAFTDPASTSGHLVPQSFLRKRKIKLKEAFFAGRHDNVVSMVYQKKVDAGATYHILPDQKGVPRDARAKVLTQYPDVMEKVKILTLSDPIPNAPWILRKNIYKNKAKFNKLKNAVQEAMISFVKTKAGNKITTELMNIQSLKKITDSEYQEKLKVFDKDDLGFLK